MLTEAITWRPVAPESMPDADLVVNVAIVGGEEPVWLGAFDGEVWRDTEGMQIEVTHWAPMLAGPAGVTEVVPPRPFDPEDNLETAIRRFGGRMVLNRTPRGRKILAQLEAIYAEPADGVQGLGDGAERRVEAFIEKRRVERNAGVPGTFNDQQEQPR